MCACLNASTFVVAQDKTKSAGENKFDAKGKCFIFTVSSVLGPGEKEWSNRKQDPMTLPLRA